MKKIIVTLSICFAFGMHLFADGKIPANVVLLDQSTNTYMDIHEVTIGDWLVYQKDLKTSGGEDSWAYKNSFPDKDICYQAYKTENYLTDPVFLNYPVVGITYEQARAYCGWRTDNANRDKKKSNTTTYMYFLPTEKDFQNAYNLQETKTSVKSIAAVDLKSKALTSIADNVKEMTEDRKVIAGESSNGLRVENYSEAGVMLGFRCKLILK
jgi:formylglycine-generating enzyme required for sulfatase activity